MGGDEGFRVFVSGLGLTRLRGLEASVLWDFWRSICVGGALGVWGGGVFERRDRADKITYEVDAKEVSACSTTA